MANVNTTHIQNVKEISDSIKTLENLLNDTRGFLNQLQDKAILNPVSILVIWFSMRYCRVVVVLKKMFEFDGVNITAENYGNLRFCHDHYEFRYVMCLKAENYESFVKEYKLTFKDRNNYQYMVHVEEYFEQFYVVKFYLKAHTKSDKRYLWK